ncbi:MAG: hypothetical protein KOO66_06180 [Bacteroidales bacterium]|nr:hypothetical protein [Bacteroidales bacterium]
MRKLILVILTFLIYTNTLNAQENTFNNIDLGLGTGINYGGFGMSLTYVFTPILSIEGHCGYNFVDIVGGGALNIHLVPKNKTKFYSLTWKSMYGYNAIMKNEHGKLESFYGVNFGLINEFRFGSKKKNGINIGIIVPLRSEDFKNTYEDMVDSGHEMSDGSPVLISIGFHIETNK